MRRLGSWLLSFNFCLLSVFAGSVMANGDCASGMCGSSSMQYGPRVPEMRSSVSSISVSRSRVVDIRQPLPVYNIEQYADCRPGECYLFEELVNCTTDEFTCRDGTRRIWSYRPLYYPRDNTELLVNLHKKLCPNRRNCIWPYTMRNLY